MAILSDELRPPSSALPAYLRLMQEGLVGADRLDRVIETLASMSQLVADVLDESPRKAERCDAPGSTAA